MRAILFRGKRVDNGEWIEGYYVCVGGTYHYILTGKISIYFSDVGYEKHRVTPETVVFEKHTVIPETVGQYTGLTDKNGNKIFEGDVVKLTFSEVAGKIICDVNYYIEAYLFGKTTRKLLSDYFPNNLEIIGNIDDNPELLEQEG